MEHRNNLDFSISVLNNEWQRMFALHQLMKDGNTIKKQLNKKMLFTQEAINRLQGRTELKDANFDHPLRVLRSNLHWLRQQAVLLKSSNEIIDEIEYVTKLLSNERAI
jgi:hypothetical protein